MFQPEPISSQIWQFDTTLYRIQLSPTEIHYLFQNFDHCFVTFLASNAGFLPHFILKPKAKPKDKIVQWKHIFVHLLILNRMTRLGFCLQQNLLTTIPKILVLVTYFLSSIANTTFKFLIRKTSILASSQSQQINYQQNFKI